MQVSCPNSHGLLSEVCSLRPSTGSHFHMSISAGSTRLVNPLGTRVHATDIIALGFLKCNYIQEGFWKWNIKMDNLKWIHWIPQVSISIIWSLILTTSSSCWNAGSSSLSGVPGWSAHVLLLYHYVLIYCPLFVSAAEDSEDSLLIVFNGQLFG